ncbi:hypothetical protein GWI33_012008 [Rhynchophorus ferrugineus]|uniref:Uncharacterized protein n=1 Tax=Rhynchophorus ferrugineus TaxID=354439 RepID=A0A834IU95_RHYFE|nr:hypothetical protein GWI33_012008 [Rhynchophorus ferrugineus]
MVYIYEENENGEENIIGSFPLGLAASDKNPKTTREGLNERSDRHWNEADRKSDGIAGTLTDIGSCLLVNCS